MAVGAREVFNPRSIMLDVGLAVDEEVRTLGFRILQTVTLGTPVGNPLLWQNPVAPPGYVGGHARRNWHVSLASQSDVELPGVDPTGALTLAEGRNLLTSYRGAARGVELHIQNAVPYIGRLNDGHSTQAPAGFVQRAVLAAQTAPNTRREL